ncbi:sarcosine oxidase subunit delta [Salinisphaera sp. USBA-960]|uniref:sarcosine oxidase subunit delta n=1 Tax=Salinisphaera orenii TaxID=856731 RepID=UPI000DBE69B7|nr:sarcosine oxidase subunit delta [Salifodinibacter halophilus]NNC25600.1 sarcosine oxidase subunit delta [Salifodinibacter halophilus]
MQIICPWCGERSYEEFRYGGDATVVRPTASEAADDDAWHEYIFVRDNPYGPHEEWWYHAYGCHQWFRVRRDTVTYEILSTVPANHRSGDRQA